jgi:hypothetical protein
VPVSQGVIMYTRVSVSGENESLTSGSSKFSASKVPNTMVSITSDSIRASL